MSFVKKKQSRENKIVCTRMMRRRLSYSVPSGKSKEVISYGGLFADIDEATEALLKQVAHLCSLCGQYRLVK